MCMYIFGSRCNPIALCVHCKIGNGAVIYQTSQYSDICLGMYVYRALAISIFEQHIKSVSRSQRSSGLNICGQQESNMVRYFKFGCVCSLTSNLPKYQVTEVILLRMEDIYPRTVRRTLQIVQVILRLHRIHLGVVTSYPKMIFQRNSLLGTYYTGSI